VGKITYLITSEHLRPALNSVPVAMLTYATALLWFLIDICDSHQSPFAKDTSVWDLPYSGPVTLSVLPTTPLPTFYNGEPIMWDALPSDDIDMLLAYLTQPPDTSLIPCPMAPIQTQIHHLDQQYVDFSRLLRQYGQQPFHDWPLPPSAPRLNRSFPNSYIDDSSIK
jgi:hypothetical protein